MKIGTKSVLFGAHQFLIHPLFVAAAWWLLYGFPWDPRLWVAFFVHDLGHFFYHSPNMDGPEGERHVEWGALFMAKHFGPEWGELCLYHSRFYAKKYGRSYSRLCVADKLACALEPWWLYLPRVLATGEVWEYIAAAGNREGSKYAGEPNTKYESMGLETGTVRSWHRTMTSYLRRWAYEHRDGKQDTWTPEPKKAA